MTFNIPYMQNRDHRVHMGVPGDWWT